MPLYSPPCADFVGWQSHSGTRTLLYVRSTASAREILSMARARNRGGKDFSALLDALCETAGLEKVRF